MAECAAGPAITFRLTVYGETFEAFGTFRNFVAALVDDAPLAIPGPRWFALDDFAIYRFVFEVAFSKFLKIKAR